MNLYRVPGVRNYRATSEGIASVGSSSGLQAELLKAASRGAAAAQQADPKGAYRAEARTVTSGWKREKRAGAAVVQTKKGRLSAADALKGWVSRGS